MTGRKHEADSSVGLLRTGDRSQNCTCITIAPVVAILALFRFASAHLLRLQTGCLILLQLAQQRSALSSNFFKPVGRVPGRQMLPNRLPPGISTRS